MGFIREKLSLAKSGDNSGVGILFLLFNVLAFLFMAVCASLFKSATHSRGRSSERITPQSTVSKKDYEDIVNGLLRDISFQRPKFHSDVGLKARVENLLQSYGLSRNFITDIGPCIKTAIKYASCTYPYASPAVREAIAVYTTHIVAIDDITSDILPDLEDYSARLVLGQLHGHELLCSFTKFLGDQSRLFGKFGADMIIKGTLEYISSAVIEQSQDGAHLSPDASEFLVYFRAKTGIADPFAFMCFPEDMNPEERDLTKYISAIPNIGLFLGYVNDLLSFYKEELKEDDCPGFVQNYAKVHGSTSLQALRQLRHATIKEVRNIRSILADDAPTTERINQFIYGYIFYHLSAGRYRLAELNIPAALEAKGCFQELK
ncbi:terpenoid synthase [Aspergillus ibericus CBS 121593]|uniref:Terpenoid synthase n=1 Tax=Aspergillus ibericus CBS 121593 TaxID=1448316 RepID=A0A395GXF6_9EURO|nr:terpenoid synthase [Aspergillus ibericus CBS 121593]RAK98743.1 terpenoid synthase [Aspergillus ibericus CBS 121593]